MKKKLIFGGMVLLALVLTTGTFAYTYTNANSTTLVATMADGAFATYQASAGQPEWDNILPEGEYGSEILIPEFAGDTTSFPTQFPDSGEHWDKVDEQPADDLGTYISTLTSGAWQQDLYNLSSFTGAGGQEVITSVTIYFRYAAGGAYNTRVMAALKTNGQVFEGPTIIYNSTTFTTGSWECSVNPATDGPWTWEEINALQAGVTARGNSTSKPLICTQVYVQVNYEFSNTQGEVPQGNLFDINPNPEYTGDLMVKIHLTNTGALLKAYQYVNMKIYIAESVEAGETPNYRVLSIETGVATFIINGGSATMYNVQLVGGSYRLISDDPDEWGAGWSIVPEFYCEVTQR